MSKDKPDNKFTISEDDAALFRSKVKGATPVKSDRIVHNIRPKSSAENLSDRNFVDPAPSLHDLSTDGIDYTVDANKPLFFTRPGLQHRHIKKLKRGGYPIEARLDLHGHTAVRAREKLVRFISQCQYSSIKCVIVVHGRGIRSQDGVPILKQAVDQWLRSLPQVMAFSSAIPKDGGMGAVYVLLKRH